MGWLEDAPRSHAFMIAPATLDDGDHAWPAIGFAFKGPDEQEGDAPAVTITLTADPSILRLFVRLAQKSCHEAEQQTRKRQKQLDEIKAKKLIVIENNLTDQFGRNLETHADHAKEDEATE
jgi:predicted oxidoreductase